MTRIRIEEDGSLRKIMVNGRFVGFPGRIDELTKHGGGRWSGVAGGEKFEIIGGKESGGASDEWFLKWPPAYGDQYAPMKSATQCIRGIERA